ncbi:M20/M25/M40 family metallo-hydrolase [Nocardia cyriacigeorgica]|uniref:M20/M25/M40 family metallo-hydrolase n=1 Tax=Nocardia cyriacigeorgica TaxID=135487 RepID=UPI001894DAC8|nr:M20/M25/M40 family metallo-hydrolase [Nocardia cyriacigeorgica]MBF6452139.1 M20/M25/M40 family metallo-hydrolase [Nocardia cyriacigeorgica]MBF6478068.1 M20/M25/M40 family metallo-hydrolase [Nocardia cyriacigeorgica]MBF6549308.1 M20/M25/M40 family metallo-hydrolase [Nocardia cyriacigeorgica]
MTGTFTESDLALLVELLAMPTVGPMEDPNGPPPRLRAAGRRYAQAAAGFGMRVHSHTAPDPAVLQRPDVPLTVRECAAERADFLDCQPSLVLRWGPPVPVERTIMFNVHLDTVAGVPEPRVEGGRVIGRGAIDAKGPAVALLAGLRSALSDLDPAGSQFGVLVQAVAGEEGGAMGTFGTRPLLEAGLYGRINVFCEPTGGRLLTRSTAAMTARISVTGDDAIDDRPGTGHNASVLLGYLAHALAEAAPRWADGGRVCVAGLHTGEVHNRVYGSGTLLLNIAYADTATGNRIRSALEQLLPGLLADFSARHADSVLLGRTAADAAAITHLTWLKSGLPALDSQDSHTLRIAAGAAEIPLVPADEPGFTCDAIWLAEQPDVGAVIFGPGDLDANNAHAAGEFAELADLDTYAGQIGGLVGRFAAAIATDPTLERSYTR